jgi:hypothetical protein
LLAAGDLIHIEDPKNEEGNIRRFEESLLT